MKRLFLVLLICLLSYTLVSAEIDTFEGQSVSNIDTIEGQSLSNIDKIEGQDLPAGGPPAGNISYDAVGQNNKPWGSDLSLQITVANQPNRLLHLTCLTRQNNSWITSAQADKGGSLTPMIQIGVEQQIGTVNRATNWYMLSSDTGVVDVYVTTNVDSVILCQATSWYGAKQQAPEVISQATPVTGTVISDSMTTVSTNAMGICGYGNGMVQDLFEDYGETGIPEFQASTRTVKTAYKEVLSPGTNTFGHSATNSQDMFQTCSGWEPE